MAKINSNVNSLWRDLHIMKLMRKRLFCSLQKRIRDCVVGTF